MNIKFIAIVYLSSIFLWEVSAQDKIEIIKIDSLTYELNQVTVTATRNYEPLIKVPYAVSIKLKKEFENVKGYGLDEVLSNIPGVLAQSRNGNQDIRIVIRGFGARGSGDRSNSGTSRGIRILLDGIPETEPDGRTSFDQIDLSTAQSVEVLRSNISALWGNASGGIINVSTIPSFSGSILSTDYLIGSFGFQKFVLKAGSNLGDGKIFGSFSQTYFSGWREHSASKRGVVNLRLVSQMSNKTLLKISLAGASNIFHIPGPLTDSQFNADPKMANPTYLARDERRYNRLGKMGFTLEHSFNKENSVQSMFYLNPKYLQRSERGTFRDFTRYHLGGSLIYQNIIKINDGISNRAFAGIDEAYQDGAILFYNLSPINSRGNALVSNKREGANTFGLFFHDELNFKEKITVLLGGRYDNVTYLSEDFLNSKLGLQKKSFEKFTPKIALSYHISPAFSVYANVSSGIEVPAGNETDPASTSGQDTIYLLNPLLDAIRSATYEIGIKHVLDLGIDFLRTLSYEAAAYHIQIKNDIIPYRGGRFYFTAGKTHRSGVEFSSSVVLKNGIMFDGALTYSNNKYIEYIVDSVHYGKPGKFADYSNNDAAGIPRFFYSAGLGYSPEFLPEIFIKIFLNGVGKYYADDANKIKIPAYNVFNLSLGLNDELNLTNNLGIRFFVNVNNLTDEKYAASAFINPDFVDGQPVYLEPGLPRNITASVSLSVQ